MKKIVVTVLFILWRVYSPAQLSIDSLQRALAVSKVDTNKVLILQELAYSYALGGSASAVNYANRGIQLSKELKYLKGEALCLKAIAVYYRLSGSSAQGMYYALKSLPLFEEQKDVD